MNSDVRAANQKVYFSDATYQYQSIYGYKVYDKQSDSLDTLCLAEPIT